MYIQINIYMYIYLDIYKQKINGEKNVQCWQGPKIWSGPAFVCACTYMYTHTSYVRIHTHAYVCIYK